MITRRSLLSMSIAAAAAPAEASTCNNDRRIFRSSGSEVARMMDLAAHFRLLYNRNDIDAIVGGEDFSFVALPRATMRVDHGAALREFRQAYGAMLTSVSSQNCLIWPEGPKLSFAVAMETRPEDEDIAWGLSCGPIGGHSQFIFGLRFRRNRVSGRLEDWWNAITIDW